MTTAESTAPSTFEDGLERWHADGNAITAIHWVGSALTGLYWLTEDFETVADLPGRWRADAGRPMSRASLEPERFEPVEGAPGLLVADGDRRIEVIAEPARWRCGCMTPITAPAGVTRYPHLPAERELGRHGHGSHRSRRGRSRHDGRGRGGARASSHRRRRSSISTWRAPRCNWSPSAARRWVGRTVHRRHQRSDDIPCVPVTLGHLTGSGWDGDTRLQQGIELALRIHRLRHVSGGTGREQVDSFRRGRREESAVGGTGCGLGGGYGSQRSSARLRIGLQHRPNSVQHKRFRGSRQHSFANVLVLVGQELR